MREMDPPPPSMHFDVSSFSRYRFCVGQCLDFGKFMEVIVKLGKTNTMTNTWGKTKTKTPRDKKVESKRISVKFSNRLQRHLATKF